MKKYYNPENTKWEAILERPTQKVEDIEKLVLQIFNEVKEQGDEAVKKYSQLFDGNGAGELRVKEQELDAAKSQVSEELKSAIDLARQNIRKFHAAQKTEKVSVETVDGVKCWQEKRPIQKIGLYIPGGTAPLFSTILMLAVPAQVAGCKEVILCTPPAKDGSVNPVILYTAQLCGIKKIYKVGGIQAVAAMTFGTESVKKVYKIFGPGNQYVTVAKQLATKFNVAIDMPAGPSELLVVADETADAAFVASDLLSQAEHGSDSQVVLVSLSKQFLEQVEAEINQQIGGLPRKDIAKAAIEHSRFVFMESQEKALDLINEYAPEHFIICTEDPDFFVDGINNAGSVFIGNYTPESAGDYASGTNHTLPTNGYAKQYSGVNLDSFTKAITFQEISSEGIQKIGRSIELMAEAEGLQGHKNAVTLRLNKLQTSGNE
jgi:histidinol dehydrogenase